MPDFYNDELENGTFTDLTDLIFIPSGVTALTLSDTEATFGVPLAGDGSGLTNLPSLTPFKQNTTSALTGTIANTIITSILIPAGTFQANDWLRWLFTVNPTANANVKTIRIYFNTSASLTGAIQVAQRSLINAVTQPILRTMFFVNSLTSQKTIVDVTLNTASDEATTGTQATLAIDFTVNQYFIIAGQLDVGTDTITVNGITSQISR